MTLQRSRCLFHRRLVALVVAVLTGSTYLWVTGGESVDGGRDAAHQQNLPVSALGSDYVGGGVATRMASNAPETVFYRIVGVVDGTTLDWGPNPPSGVPTTLSAGQIAQFGTTSPFHVQSQDSDHPFSLTQYMTGSRHEAHSNGPFGITVWGTDWCASYAYPASASLRAINSVTFGP